MSRLLPRNFFCSGDACVASRQPRIFRQSSTLRVDRDAGVATACGQIVRIRRVGGFTLVEVLATMMLMALVLPALMRGATIALAIGGFFWRRHKTEAASLAEAD